MSLFKLRSLWSTTVGNGEEFDQGCMCVGNVDNRPNTPDKIVVGSYHGYLRIYLPHPEKTENGFGSYRPEDVLCENNLQYPILQVEIGRFTSGTDGNLLAVLHPRKLSVYNFVGTSGAVEHGMQYQLKLLYEHNLQRTACNFCYGPFGGVKGKDFMCVQSMDGTLSIFEQESFAFSRFLPGALLPGPLAYLPRTDSFVTVSSSREVECYKFQVLAVATDVKSRQESMNLKSGKRVAADWTLNIGEQAIDLRVASFLNDTHIICVLGERSYFGVSEVGKLQFVKKLEVNPSCFLPYRSVSDKEIQCVMGTHTNTLLILHNITLRWAAQLDYCPVQVRTANLLDLRGILVTLSSDGRLDCSYLGTDPAMFTAPTAELREIDYNQLDAEMKELQNVIKQQQSKSVPTLPSNKTEEGLQIIVSVPPNLDEPSLASDVEIRNEDNIPSITVKISLKAKSVLNDVKLGIHTSPPLAVNEDLISFSSIEANHLGETQVTFYMKYGVLPADLRAEVTATYQSVTGAPRVTSSVIRLPLMLVCKPVLPVKQADYKITVDTNKPPVNLNDIFPDLLGENAGSSGNALGFAFYGLDSVVTVLASQKSQRYRLQSDDFASMWPLLSELVMRLRGHFGNSRSTSDFRVSYDGALPLQEYFDVLDSHFECRQNADKLNKLLEERATQFRAIQRRLLTRFKDKTPAPLSNLDTLLDGTYRQIMALAEAADENRVSLTCCGAALSCATRALNLMVRLWLDLPEAEYAVLEMTLLPTVVDNGTQGWEEMVDAAITHLLRTTLAKSAKDQTVNPSPLTLLRDTTKLKKHIALLIDKLSKGAKLVIEGVTPALATKPPAKSTQKPPVRATPTDSTPSTLHTTLDTLHESTHSDIYQPIREPETTPEPLPSLPPPLPPQLSPLGGRTGSDFIKKSSAVESVPDLDDMSVESDDTLLNPHTNELVYGL